MSSIREILIDNGVRALQEFGYHEVNKDNIVKDFLYCRFFMSYLKQTVFPNEQYEQEASKLLTELRESHGT